MEILGGKGESRDLMSNLEPNVRTSEARLDWGNRQESLPAVRQLVLKTPAVGRRQMAAYFLDLFRHGKNGI